MISGHCKTALVGSECYQTVPLKVTSEEDWLKLALTVISTFILLNDVTDLRYNTLATSASSTKSSAFHCFRCLLTIKYTENA